MTAPAHVFTTADVDPAVLDQRTVAVLGFGNQGSAQGQNLRDSGIRVIVGNRDDEYRDRARAARFRPVELAQVARAGEVVLLLISDEVQPKVFADQIAAQPRGGDTLVVVSGYNWTFGLLDVPDGVDVVMVAPRMIGEAVRARYLSSGGFPCFVSVEHDATRLVQARALAIAGGIGATTAGAIVSNAREEAALDLFTEQAIWPAILDVLRTAYDVLRDAGFSDQAVLYEMYLSAEPAEVFARAAETGLLDQLRLHSQSSQYGQLRALRALTAGTGQLGSRFHRVLHDDILTGAFATEWSGCADAAATLDKLRTHAAALPIAAAEQAVRACAASRSRTDAPGVSGRTNTRE